ACSRSVNQNDDLCIGRSWVHRSPSFPEIEERPAPGRCGSLYFYIAACLSSQALRPWHRKHGGERRCLPRVRAPLLRRTVGYIPDNHRNHKPGSNRRVAYYRAPLSCSGPATASWASRTRDAESSLCDFVVLLFALGVPGSAVWS